MQWLVSLILGLLIAWVILLFVPKQSTYAQPVHPAPPPAPEVPVDMLIAVGLSGGDGQAQSLVDSIVLTQGDPEAVGQTNEVPTNSNSDSEKPLPPL
jgi:hypothetical protein